MIKDYFSLAFGNLKHRGLRSWLTMLGIFIGIAAVVSLISLGNGLESAVLGQFGTLSFDKLTIQNKGTGFGPPGSTVVEKLNEKDIEIIESVSGVKRVLSRLIRVVKTEFNGISNFNYVVDVPVEKENIELFYESLNLEIEKGKLIAEGDRGKILLGSDLADGEIFDKELEVGKKIILQGKEFEIAGILKKSSSVQMNFIIFVPREDLEEILEIENEYDIIIAQVEDKEKIEEVAEEIEQDLRKNRKEKIGEETFSVETPLQSLNSVKSILNIINAIVAGIAGISLLVGGVGIANTMYTSVVERTKEIGVMKAVGARNSDILWVFVIESGLLGLVGGIIGALIGLGTAIGISLIANQALGGELFVIEINYLLLFGAIGFSFLLGTFFGVFPALQASKLNVVDALRK